MPDERPRESSGEYLPEVSDDDLFAVLREAETPVLTAPQIATEVPIGRKAVLERLRDLEEDGRVASMEVGARAVVWWAVETNR